MRITFAKTMQIPRFSTFLEVQRFLKNVLLDVYDEQEAGSVAEYYCTERWGVSRTALLTGELVQLVQQPYIEDDIQRLYASEPVQYVVGHAWFAGLRLTVDTSVLIPRPETEELLNLVQSDKGAFSVIVDWCTGSGCLALGLKFHFPHAQVFGFDLSADALSVARRNGQSTDIEVVWQQSDVLRQPWPAVPPMDILVANPPYVLQQEASTMHPNVLRYEPHLALFVHEYDPLFFYRALIQGATSRAAPGFRGWFEINPIHAEELVLLAREEGYKDVAIVQDSAGKQRFLRVSEPGQ